MKKVILFVSNISLTLLFASSLLKANCINPPSSATTSECSSPAENNMEDVDEPVAPMVEIIENDKEEKHTDTKLQEKSTQQLSETDTLETSSSMYKRGEEDAKNNYSAIEPGSFACVLSIFLPLISIFPCLLILVSPPCDANLNCPHPDLLKNPYYYEGYLQKAHKIKARKVLKNCLFGTLIFIGIVVGLALIIEPSFSFNMK